MFTRLMTARPEVAFPSMETLMDTFLAGTATRPGATTFPAINVWEDEQALHVEAELPGYSMSDVDITTLGNELTIAGSRRGATPDNVHFRRRERDAGGAAGFKRTLRIGVPIDTEKVKATLVSGVLTVTLPKAEAAKPRKIEIRGA